MTLELVVLGLFLFAGWFWVDSMRAREVALDAGRRACEAESVQFLDWTVAVASIRIARAADGRIRLRRIYNFEFSDTGNNRLKGSITLLGTSVLSVHLSPGERSHPHVAHLH
ncbi:MAG: DUF3301 domain-containing protein [Betaproteobacteria bacterium]|nr:MAG: DUF3301 domain-containing protein [Betaproteobacteria bacterium]